MKAFDVRGFDNAERRLLEQLQAHAPDTQTRRLRGDLPEDTEELRHSRLSELDEPANRIGSHPLHRGGAGAAGVTREGCRSRG